MKWKRLISISVLIVAALVAIRFSFYTEPLEEHRQKALLKQFSPNQLVDYHWENDLEALLQTAIPVQDFMDGMSADAKGYSEKHARVPCIGAKSYFLISGQTLINAISDQSLTIQLDDKTTGRIQIRFLFGNTARDATGWFNAADFQNTMDFNTLSTYLNTRILNEVAKPAADGLKTGDKLTWWGAVEIAPDNFPVTSLDIVPLWLKIN